jgi:hypothetical protein
MLRFFAPLGAAALLYVPAAGQIATTANDFVQPGTQPATLTSGIASIQACTFCHSDFDPDEAPFERWSGSMMANSMRDPVFQAAMTIANQDMTGSGEHCMRCHAPGGWMEGRATPADGSAMVGQDFEGVNCNLCHRLVDPVSDPANPIEDPAILAALSPAPTTAHGGQMIVDPLDRRRGPYDLGPNFFWHEWRQSPYHRESLKCASCHEVSNPAFVRVGGGTPSASDTYALDTLDAQHPTHAKTDQFPVERTFTEWLLSDFAVAPIEMGGRYGGNQTAVSTCQDCHMPTTTGTACQPFLEGETRTDLPQHDFNGANSWVPLSIYSLDQSLDLYPETHVNGQPLSIFEEAVARNIAMLRAAGDLALSKVGTDLVVRITNQTGHKLPTGYAEGRRMWINVKFKNYEGALLDERGEYDWDTADLETGDTKVYEVLHGLDASMAALTGLPAAHSFHFTLNNKIYKDNRIPPRGYEDAAFEAGQAQPVGASYADGQYWDDTAYPIPVGADFAIVSVYHQTTSKEYIEFLRDENTTDTKGDIAYDEWVDHGKSRPVLMDRGVFRFTPGKAFSKKKL